MLGGRGSRAARALRLLLLPAGCSALLAACPAAFASSGGYLVDVWDTDRGLPSSSVTSIAQTGEGYLWVGTQNGLVRFDGVRLETFDPITTPELGHARIENLFVDKAGTLWINSYDGSLSSWRRGVFAREWTGRRALEPGIWPLSSRPEQISFLLETGEVIRRRLPAPAGSAWQMLRPPGAKLVPVSCEDREAALWIRAADHGLWRLAGDAFQAVAWRRGVAGTRINHLAADLGGRVWIATEREIATWDRDRFRVSTPPTRAARTDVSFLFFARSGDYWAIVNGRARRARAGSWIQVLDVGPGLTGAYRLTLSALEDREGGVWFTHYGKGLLHVRPDGAARAVALAEGLPGERVRCSFEDREGNLWLGVDRGGLVRLRQRRFEVLAPGSGLPAKAASSVIEDARGAVWIGTLGGGLDRWRSGRLTHFRLPAATSGESVFSLAPDGRGRLFMSADQEDLFLFDGRSVRPAPWQVHGIKALLLDRRGRLWLGRKDGLSCLTAGRLRSFGPEDGFEHSDVRALAEDARGVIWIGAGDGAVYRLVDDRLEARRPADEQGPHAIWALLPDADGESVWVGTFRGGLLRLKDGRFTRATTRNGLPSDVVCQILDDGQGRLWLGTHQGIVRVAKASLHALAEGKTRSLPCLAYGRSDGLPTLECSGSYQPSSWRGRDGRLWFATSKGVVGVQPRAIAENRLAPPVVIEEVLADGEPMVLPREQATRVSGAAAADAPASRALEIAPGNRRVEFRYTGLSLTAPDRVLFRYRLEGLEHDWVDAGGRRSAQYSYLRPGSYRFRVIACNSDGAWNEAGAAVTLRVLPRFFERWWFPSGTGLVVIGLVAGAVRYVTTRRLQARLERLERQRAVERDRARIAKDIHDDLGAGLTQITLLSELARSDSPQETDAHLAQISDTARELTRTMDEIVWAVNPRNDTLDSLTTYLSNFAQEYLTLAGIQSRLDLPAQLPALPLTSEVRHNLFLAVKEALTNVVKHAGAREAWLRLTASADAFTFVIQDDGRGFDPELRARGRASGDRLAPGQGLDNLEKRLAAIGGRCVVLSAPGAGTRVELRVALG